MKQKFLSFSLSLIKEKHSDIDDIKLDEIRYGLEGLYLTITKFIVISLLALILNIFKEMILLLIFFNILRRTGFGMHASKSLICLIASSLVFLLLPLSAKYINLSLYIKSILSIIGVLLIFKNTPADTIKRPLINKKKREKFKFITTIKCIIMCFCSFIIKYEYINNLLIIAVYIEVFLTSPYIYKLFHLSYNNYLNYETT